MDKVRRVVAFKIFDGVVKKTPVDTGRARGNWQICVGKDNTDELDRTDKRELGTPSSFNSEEKAKLKQVKGDETIYIVNNLPYITKLEYGGYSENSETGKTRGGYSIQAPQGMAGITMGNISRNIEKYIKAKEEEE